MTPQTLIADLLALGAVIRYSQCKPMLSWTNGVQKLTDEQAAALKEHRERVLASLPEDVDEVQCEECNALIYDRGDMDIVFDLCRKTLCPYWRADHPASSPGLVRQRSYALWKRANGPKFDSCDIPD